MKKILVSAFILTTAFSCKKIASNDLKDDVPYYQTYEVAYNKHDNTYTGMASFLVRTSSGSRIQLSDNASIKMNNNEPWVSATDKTTYHWNGTGAPDANFILTKNSGKKITNAVKRTDISDIDFGSFITAPSKSSGFSFTLTGTPLTDTVNEWISISFTPESISSYSGFTKTVTGTTVQVSATDLQYMPTGKMFINITHGKTMNLKEADDNASGGITIRLQNTKETTLSN